GRHASGSYLEDRVTAVWERTPDHGWGEHGRLVKLAPAAPVPAPSHYSHVHQAVAPRMPGAPDVARLRELVAHTKRVAEAIESAPAGSGPVSLARHLVVNHGLRAEE